MKIEKDVNFEIYMIIKRKYGEKERKIKMKLYEGMGGWMLVGVEMMIDEDRRFEDMNLEMKKRVKKWMIILILGKIGKVSKIIVVKELKIEKE